MNKPLPKSLLFDFFDGKATAIQRKLIEAWLTEDRNEDLFYQYLDEWESQHPQLLAFTDKAFDSFREVLNDPAGPEIRQLPPVKSVPLWRTGRFLMGLAASITVFLGVTGLVFREQIEYRTYRTDYGQTASFTLPDGSGVTLNANSSLRVPRFGFGDANRDVRLVGEGAFSVRHLPNNQRFRVNMARGVQVEVLGTEFSVFDRARAQRVFLNKGQVKLNLPQGRQLLMKPGNLITVDRTGGTHLTPVVPARRALGWQAPWFYFDNTSLTEVAEQIHEQFGVKVLIPNTALAQRRIAGNFKAEKADDLLQILSQLLHLNVVRTRTHIELNTSN